MQADAADNREHPPRAESGGYLVPASKTRVEEVIRRSRFITTIERAGTPAAARDLVRRVKAEFPDATHNCWAFAAGPPGDTAHIGSSDDGEPSGTAGRPMLQVLLHGDIGEVAAVVTRFYGGTKLGTGGLARAYSGGVRLALDGLRTELKVIRIQIAVEIPYAQVDTLYRLLAAHGALVLEEDFAERVRLVCEVPEDRFAGFEYGYADLTRGSGVIERR